VVVRINRTAGQKRMAEAADQAIANRVEVVQTAVVAHLQDRADQVPEAILHLRVAGVPAAAEVTIVTNLVKKIAVQFRDFFSHFLETVNSKNERHSFYYLIVDKLLTTCTKQQIFWIK
jgi:hypothetical protein